jgi:hypothetical protein
LEERTLLKRIYAFRVTDRARRERDFNLARNGIVWSRGRGALFLLVPQIGETAYRLYASTTRQTNNEDLMRTSYADPRWPLPNTDWRFYDEVEDGLFYTVKVHEGRRWREPLELLDGGVMGYQSDGRIYRLGPLEVIASVETTSTISEAERQELLEDIRVVRGSGKDTRHLVKVK